MLTFFGQFEGFDAAWLEQPVPGMRRGLWCYESSFRFVTSWFALTASPVGEVDDFVAVHHGANSKWGLRETGRGRAARPSAARACDLERRHAEGYVR